MVSPKNDLIGVGWLIVREMLINVLTLDLIKTGEPQFIGKLKRGFLIILDC